MKKVKKIKKLPKMFIEVGNNQVLEIDSILIEKISNMGLLPQISQADVQAALFKGSVFKVLLESKNIIKENNIVHDSKNHELSTGGHARTSKSAKSILNDLMESNGPKTPRRNLVNKPSEKPIYTRWKNKEIDKWTSMDLFGFYLYTYKKVVGEEDITFCGNSSTQHQIMTIASFTKSSVAFDNDKSKVKEYIEWTINWIMNEDSWVNSIVNFGAIFTLKSIFLKEFKAHGREKPKNKRTSDDKKFADKGAWNNYLS